MNISISKSLLLICLTGTTLPAFPDSIPGPVFPLQAFPVSAGHMDALEIAGEIPGYEAGAVAPPFGPLAAGLERLNGVDLRRRGLNTVEPVIGGHSGDRVATDLNGLSLPNAAPTRTAAPVNFLDLPGHYRIRVVRSPASVANGPVPIGGRLSFITDAVPPSPPGAWLAVDGNLGGIEAGFRGGRESGNHAVRAAVQYTDHGDFESGGGDRVDADYTAVNLAASGSHRLQEKRFFHWALHHSKLDRVRNASLPLDTLDSPMWAMTMRHSLGLESGSLELLAGYARMDAFLSSAERRIAEGAPVRRIVARSPARSAMAGARYRSDRPGEWHFLTGVDVRGQTRNTLRKRVLVNGTVFRDRLWPDVKERGAGAYAVLSGPRNRSLAWDLSIRLDRTESRAGDADAPVEGIPVAQGATVRENYAAFNGTDAANTTRRYWTGSAHALLSWRIDESMVLSGGLGLTRAVPGVGERYRAFVNALGGGFELGNPDLDAEESREAFLRFQAGSGFFVLQAGARYSAIRDYVRREAVRDTPLVYSFRNTEARFYGCDLGLRIILAEETDWRLTLPVRAERVWGRDRERSRDLTDLPPWSASIGLDGHVRTPVGRLHFVAEARHTGAAENPDPALNPIFADTDSHTLLNVEMRLETPANLTLGLRIDNLTDRLAYAYLQPPVVDGVIGPSDGTLQGGDRVPLPGRRVIVFLEKAF